MYRWAECPGSIRLTKGIKSVSSEFAAEGTVAHDIGAKVLGGAELISFLGTKQKADGHEFEVTEEMLEAVEVYAQAVKAALVTNTLIEHKFDLTSVYPGLYGTADCVQFDKPRKLLRVMDYKHGAGVAVEVVEKIDGKDVPNPQLMYYALGALMTCGFEVNEVELVIVQPRCPHVDGPVRRYRLSAIDLMDFATELIDYAKATEDPNAPLNPGDHCRFCAAAGVCPAIHARATETAKQVFGPASAYDPKALASTLAWLPVLEAWAKNVRQFAYNEVEGGKAIPGYKLVAKRANRVWKDVAAAETALKAAGLGEPEMYGEPELQSPSKIEKALTARKIKPADRAATLDPLVEKVSSGHTLVEESDARPVVKQSAADAFANA